MFCYELAVTNRVFREILDLSPGWLSMRGVGVYPPIRMFFCAIFDVYLMAYYCILLAIVCACMG